MLRPFKNIEELKTKTGIFVGDILPIRVKQDIFPKELYFHKWLVTELNFSNKTVGLGTHLYPLEDLCKNFEFQKDNKWQSFGVEETSTRPAKFKTGKKYFYYDDDDYENEIFINAKYIDPKDKAVTVVFEDVAVRIVKLDSDGNEYIDCNDSEDGSIKAINEVKREE